MIFEYDCAVCGTHVRKKRSPATAKVPPRFCSQRCNGIARRGTGNGPTPNHEYDCVGCGSHCVVYRSPSAPTPRFCSVQCTGLSQRGSGNPSYSGGRHVGTNGYVFVLAPDHPSADPRGYVYEHRLVMEQSMGRLLTPSEVVHHKNQVKTDNRPGNLQLMASQSEHAALHQKENASVGA